MEEYNIKRILFSRKLWGAVLATISIVISGKIMEAGTAAIAIPALGTLWGLAIGGQAAYDYIKGKQNGEQ